jgi:hypothetical protein
MKKESTNESEKYEMVMIEPFTTYLQNELSILNDRIDLPAQIYGKIEP